MTLPSESDIVFSITIMATIFAVFKYFRDPQIKTEKKTMATSIELASLKADLTNLKDNHIHTLTEGLKSTNENVVKLTIEVSKLGTIIDERIPKKMI